MVFVLFHSSGRTIMPAYRRISVIMIDAWKRVRMKMGVKVKNGGEKAKIKVLQVSVYKERLSTTYRYVLRSIQLLSALI